MLSHVIPTETAGKEGFGWRDAAARPAVGYLRGNRTHRREDTAGRMTQFMGTHTNRLDAKGRVSIPASFRALLKPAEPGTAPLVLRPSHKFACVEGWPVAAFNELAIRLDEFDAFGDEHEAMSLALYADAYEAEPDKDGRVVLTDALRKFAGLTEQVMFMGIGKTFQIWEPEAGLQRIAEARERARALTKARAP
jgi:MraZ protein